MWLLRHSTLAAATSGFLAGFYYHKLMLSHQSMVSCANLVPLDIDEIISSDIERHAIEHVPFMKFGFPSYDTLKAKKNFILSYDRRNKVPNWVMEHLTSDMLFGGETPANRRKSHFFEDETTHKYFRATLDDYKWSEYGKGHLAAAGNYKYSQASMDETFVLSNIAPQDRSFNQGTWNNLEKRVRNLVKRHGSVYVCSGPLYLPRREEKKDSQSKTEKFIKYDVIGSNDVAVPTHFFKVIVCELKTGEYNMEAYVIPNQNLDPKRNLAEYMVPRDVIERAAGFLLFHNLPSNAISYINGKENPKCL